MAGEPPTLSHPPCLCGLLFPRGPHAHSFGTRRPPFDVIGAGACPSLDESLARGPLAYSHSRKGSVSRPSHFQPPSDAYQDERYASARQQRTQQYADASATRQARLLAEHEVTTRCMKDHRRTARVQTWFEEGQRLYMVSSSLLLGVASADTLLLAQSDACYNPLRPLTISRQHRLLSVDVAMWRPISWAHNSIYRQQDDECRRAEDKRHTEEKLRWQNEEQRKFNFRERGRSRTQPLARRREMVPGFGRRSAMPPVDGYYSRSNRTAPPQIFPSTARGVMLSIREVVGWGPVCSRIERVRPANPVRLVGPIIKPWPRSDLSKRLAPPRTQP
ncbi:hypothetical protein FRC12_016503 [Ceratobasidium sp. 428]|nr:hypothetical protein FRC12_016503 [Ceratobasidium sp. 428]